ncbi:MAG: protein translocase subunit SecD [Ignavibacteriae bacterium]|nr:protein translocase subunit SecD [Ignavibacteriota bacterium]MCB9215316.1 protein translocase subunit SecD [Ignavibacteria bacterium]
MSARFRIIIIVLALAASVWQLWPTWTYYQLNNERESLVNDTVGNPAAYGALATWDSLHGQDWSDAREGRIKLGLDLRGGVYTTVEVDIPALLYETADKDLIDDMFEKVIAAVREEAALSDDPVIDIFTRKFNEIARPQGRTLLDYYELGDLPGSAGDDAIIDKLTDNIDDAVNQATEVIRQRVDKYGLTEPSIQKQGSRRIIVELPDEKDPERVGQLLSQTARLEFKLVKNDAAIVEVFKQIDQLLTTETPGSSDAKSDEKEDPKTTDTAGGTNPTDTTTPAPKKETTTTNDSGDSTGSPSGGDTNGSNTGASDTNSDTGNNPYEGLPEDEQYKKFQALHPFSSNFATYYQAGYHANSEPASGVVDLPTIPAGEYTFLLNKDSRAKVQELLKRPEIRGLIPEDRVIAFSATTRDPNDPESAYEMFVLKAESEMNGEVVTDAQESIDAQEGRPIVTMAMSIAGAERWAEITGENVEKRVAVVLDSSVYSAPWIQEKISGGSTRITGSSDLKDAELLATVLKSGALKAPIKIIEQRVVGPSLGADQIAQGINAVLFAALLVILFMAIYYALGGVVADVAVALNVFFSLAMLAAFQGTLTLPGIGALVLTIGMAVDANVLIYERIREELALGKTIRNAVQLGYDKAFTAIIDSNITTFLTGMILAAFGTGPIKGFAIMLMIGIACTLFTAVFITRAVFMLVLERDVQSVNFGQPKSRVI